MGEEITVDSKFVPFVPTFWNIEIAVVTFRLTLPKKIVVHYFFFCNFVFREETISNASSRSNADKKNFNLNTFLILNISGTQPTRITKDKFVKF